MRVERKQLELLAEAVALTDAREFDLRIDNGKILLFSVETVEKLAAVPVTPQGIAQRKRVSPKSP